MNQLRHLVFFKDVPTLKKHMQKQWPLISVIKRISDGEITKKLTIEGVKVSAAAQEKIKAAGGIPSPA